MSSRRADSPRRSHREIAFVGKQRFEIARWIVPAFNTQLVRGSVEWDAGEVGVGVSMHGKGRGGMGGSLYHL
jgi:hypothetical protein